MNETFGREAETSVIFRMMSLWRTPWRPIPGLRPPKPMGNPEAVLSPPAPAPTQPSQALALGAAFNHHLAWFMIPPRALFAVQRDQMNKFRRLLLLQLRGLFKARRSRANHQAPKRWRLSPLLLRTPRVLNDLVCNRSSKQRHLFRAILRLPCLFLRQLHRALCALRNNQAARAQQPRLRTLYSFAHNQQNLYLRPRARDSLTNDQVASHQWLLRVLKAPLLLAHKQARSQHCLVVPVLLLRPPRALSSNRITDHRRLPMRLLKHLYTPT
jgi:hypothetical protein